MNKLVCFLIFFVQIQKSWSSGCEKPSRLLGAEEICWSSTVKITDRIQYHAKGMLNFAKEKLGLDTDEPFHPQQCDYYQCIFKEMKMLDDDNYPKYDKIVQFIDNNMIYNHAKVQYDRLSACHQTLTQSKETNRYFSANFQLDDIDEESDSTIQNPCEISKEFMKCLAMNNTECIFFTYP